MEDIDVIEKKKGLLLDAAIDSFVDFKRAFYEYSTIVYSGIIPDMLIEGTEHEDSLRDKVGKLELILKKNYILCHFTSGGEDGDYISWHHNCSANWEDDIFYIWPYPNSDITSTCTNLPYWDCYDPGYANCLERSAGICEDKILKLSQSAEFKNYKETLQDIIKKVRNNQSEWRPSRLHWGYIKDIDDCIKNLKLLKIGINHKDSSPTTTMSPMQATDKNLISKNNNVRTIGGNQEKDRENAKRLIDAVGGFVSKYESFEEDVRKATVFEDIPKRSDLDFLRDESKLLADAFESSRFAIYKNHHVSHSKAAEIIEMAKENASVIAADTWFLLRNIKSFLDSGADGSLFLNTTIGNDFALDDLKTKNFFKLDSLNKNKKTGCYLLFLLHPQRRIFRMELVVQIAKTIDDLGLRELALNDHLATGLKCVKQESLDIDTPKKTIHPEEKVDWKTEDGKKIVSNFVKKYEKDNRKSSRAEAIRKARETYNITGLDGKNPEQAIRTELKRRG